MSIGGVDIRVFGAIGAFMFLFVFIMFLMLTKERRRWNKRYGNCRKKTYAKILHAECTGMSSLERGNEVHLEYEVEYYVKGKRYTSTLLITKFSAYSPPHVPKGGKIKIYYDPENPQRCLSLNAKVRRNPNAQVIIASVTLAFVFLVVFFIYVEIGIKNSNAGKTSDDRPCYVYENTRSDTKYLGRINSSDKFLVYSDTGEDMSVKLSWREGVKTENPELKCFGKPEVCLLTSGSLYTSTVTNDIVFSDEEEFYDKEEQHVKVNGFNVYYARQKQEYIHDEWQSRCLGAAYVFPEGNVYDEETGEALFYRILLYSYYKRDEEPDYDLVYENLMDVVECLGEITLSEEAE